jgi:hypothetical protein
VAGLEYHAHAAGPNLVEDDIAAEDESLDLSLAQHRGLGEVEFLGGKNAELDEGPYDRLDGDDLRLLGSALWFARHDNLLVDLSRMMFERSLLGADTIRAAAR